MAARAVRRSSSSWSELVQQWRSSGQEADVFCAEHGVSAQRLEWWESELRRRALRRAARPVKPPRSESAFSELRVVSSRPSSSSAMVEVHARNGLVVRVQGTVDSALLVSVLRAVVQC